LFVESGSVSVKSCKSTWTWPLASFVAHERGVRQFCISGLIQEIAGIKGRFGTLQVHQAEASVKGREARPRFFEIIGHSCWLSRG
jgi:hypothetical protein